MNSTPARVALLILSGLALAGCGQKPRPAAGAPAVTVAPPREKDVVEWVDVVGRFEVNGMTLLVSRGTGFWGPPMRLFLPGEIVAVTLLAR